MHKKTFGLFTFNTCTIVDFGRPTNTSFASKRWNISIEKPINNDFLFYEMDKCHKRENESEE